MTDDIVDLYLATGDFHEAVRQSGLPTHIAHLKLIKSGRLTIQDKMQFLTDKNDLHVSPSGRWFNEFQIEAEELQPLLSDYAQLRKDGLF